MQKAAMLDSVRFVLLAMPLALLLSACVAITPESATPPAPSSPTPAAPATGESDNAFSGILTGTVTTAEGVALPGGSVVEVQLQDVSRADAPAEVIASQTITISGTATGKNVPIPFSLSYGPAQIEPRLTYALGVRVTVDGQLRWINTERFGALTRNAPQSGVEVIVRPVQ